MGPRFADLFCGAGGLSLGLTQAGFTPVFAFDNDPWACETYAKNIADSIRMVDARSLKPGSIPAMAGVQPGDLDLVCGGPPCQGLSVQRRGETEDPRNDLVLGFARWAIELAPRMILLENVPPLLGKTRADLLKRVTKTLEAADYAHVSGRLNASSYGVPQNRIRAFLVAWNPTRANPFQFPKPTHPPESFRTVMDAIGDLPEPPSDFTPHPDHPNHVRVRITARSEHRIAHVPPGGGRADLPEELQLPCHRNSNGHRHLDVYGRMEWDRPGPTITAMFDSFTRGRFAHPEANRAITAREGARLQSFPDDFVFLGPKKDVARQIGNAVPPLLAKRLGESLRSCLEGRSEQKSVVGEGYTDYHLASA